MAYYRLTAGFRSQLNYIHLPKTSINTTNLWPALLFGLSTRRVLLTVTALSLATMVLISTFFPTYISRPTFAFNEIVSPCGIDDTSINQGESTSIPNLVHYVWLLKDGANLHLDFKMFVSVYSAYLYMRPTQIYIHTDAAPDVFEKAKTSSDVWTQRILSLPVIAPRYIVAPTTTSSGVAIKEMEHRADFVRIDALLEYGGLYLDVDAIPLRDLTPLRESGFANVIGGATAIALKHQGYVNNGVMLASPGTLLMRIWRTASHHFFDGQWATASIFLLTDLVDRLVPVHKEVLVLHPRAFAPMSWEIDDQKRLFLPKLSAASDLSSNGYQGAVITAPAAPGVANTCQDVMAWLTEKELERNGGDKWEMDFSSTYVLHAMDGSISPSKDWDATISLEYVMSRRSNYARAVYPSIKHAVDAGIIPKSEVATFL